MPKQTKNTSTDYYKEGRQRALQLGNRGPMRFKENGRLEDDILSAYHQFGFYVCTGVLDQHEIDLLSKEFDEILENAPVSPDATTDRHGRPVKFPGYYTLVPIQNETNIFDKQANEKLEFPDNPNVGLVSHPLMMMDSALRAYGHPDILRMVASVNGDDFVPFHEAIFHKGAGHGAPTNWHQDGRTHWKADGSAIETADGNGKTHGFNLSVSFSQCTPQNCLWVVPGSHKNWRLSNGGSFPSISERIAEAVPMMLEPGDCGMVNRSSLHGSYPNKSKERRCTLLLGFHKRDSAIGTKTTNVHAFKSPSTTVKDVEYSEEYVLKRARMIPLAIDARKQKYPSENAYEYTGSYIGGSKWNDASRAEISQNGDEYWQRDITL